MHTKLITGNIIHPTYQRHPLDLVFEANKEGLTLQQSRSSMGYLQYIKMKYDTSNPTTTKQLSTLAREIVSKWQERGGRFLSVGDDPKALYEILGMEKIQYTFNQLKKVHGITSSYKQPHSISSSFKSTLYSQQPRNTNFKRDTATSGNNRTQRSTNHQMITRMRELSPRPSKNTNSPSGYSI